MQNLSKTVDNFGNIRTTNFILKITLDYQSMSYVWTKGRDAGSSV
jgi:hypothetical protein